ncbi:MAG: lactate utilization protein [Candidatus Cloacimonadota bacterium]|nr:lactate utilization protein [Candidatus Cloacimonadota bacterium]
MSEFVKWHNDLLINQTKVALEKNGFLIEIFETKDECLTSVIAQIDKNAGIGFGGSTTVKEIGLFDYLVQNDYNLINPYKPGLSRDEVFALRKKALTADLFITGTNAITWEGELVNIDGYGNRVAAITFGPKKVFLFVGMNKIVHNSEQAIDRIFDYAAPINAKRLNKNVPCVESGFCEDCDSPERICNHLVITMKQSFPDRIKIFLINEKLGF